MSDTIRRSARDHWLYQRRRLYDSLPLPQSVKRSSPLVLLTFRASSDAKGVLVCPTITKGGFLVNEALAKLTSGEREWEMGVDASLAVAKLGAGASIDTTNRKTAIDVFPFGEKGLMGDVSFQGSRFKKLEVE